MKKLTYILSAGLILLAASCGKKETPYVPGEPELDGCYGVFFPDQEAATTHYFEPSADKTVEVTVKRTNASGAIDVPYTLVAENTDVYTVGTIHFDDAQEETTLTVELNSSAEQATEYPLTIEIQDNNYAAKYSKNNAFITLSTMIVTWETLGTFTFYDYFWEEGCTAEVVYYDIDGIRTCKTQNERDRFALSEESTPGTDGGFWGTGADYHLEFKWYTEYQNADEYDYVELPATYFGFDNSTYGPVYICDYLHYYQINGRLTSYDFESYIAANNPNGFTLPYYDPRGELYFYFATPIGDSGYWYGASEIVGLKEGYVPTDYSLEISADVSSDGKSPITLKTGADVASVTYAVYEGALGNAAVGDHVAAIMKGTEEVETLAIADPTQDTLLEIALETSGEYTIIVIPANAKGELQEAEFAYTTFSYLAEGDEAPVEANMGLDTLSGKYEAQGYSSDTALEFWVYGTDIVTAKVGLFKYMDIASEAQEDVEAYVKENGDAISGENLDLVNGEGFSTIMTGLLPGTEYYAVAYLSNGYEETWIWDNATTTGDPLPIYQDFTIDSYDEDYELADASEWLGTWNYYAVDYYGSLGLREYQGKVEITASDTETEGPDDYGYYDEYVLVDGLFPNAIVDAPEYGYEIGDGKLEMDVYAGAMYSFSRTTYDGGATIQTYAKASNTFYNGVSYYGAFVPVADGYYAFVDTAGSTYDFTGLRIVQTYVWDAFYDLLLVDPSKDDNGIAPSSVNKAIASAQKHFADAAKEVDLTGNYKEDLHKIIDRYNAKTAVIKNVKYNTVNVRFTGKNVKASVKASSVPSTKKHVRNAEATRIDL